MVSLLVKRVLDVVYKHKKIFILILTLALGPLPVSLVNVDVSGEAEV